MLDPFSGSGTTAICARRTGRNFIGFELDEKHYEDSLRRYSAGIQQPLSFKV